MAGIDQKEIERKISDKRYFFSRLSLRPIDYEQAMLLKVLSADLPGSPWKLMLGEEVY